MTKTFNKIRKWITNNVKWSIGIGLLLAACMIAPFAEEEEETTNQDIFIEADDITSDDKDEEQAREDVKNTK